MMGLLEPLCSSIFSRGNEVLQSFSNHNTQAGLLGCLSRLLQGPKHDAITDSPSKGGTNDFLSCSDFWPKKMFHLLPPYNKNM